ncbi:myosin heavy chain, non-muscle [Vanessa cardui]|uniref:myosin heavy chain, non-muscle n=1 Tax=Vanessa cardui TaxID=171605 RepID=UPI001F12B816|nr:myosin heavy chain, non-muscle [Vanessa cardui]
MGSTSFLNKSKSGFRTKSGSSGGSDKEMNGKLKRSKIRRPVKMNEYGMKRIPDYTELAYKEAVSKLKYFLSGNNAPSVRSYGGSASIKNLDESDGDLDKKYSSSFNTLSEYKPRPRLTAKYATLYADSLNNYTPPQPTVTNIASADLGGGTNPDVVNFIQKQEEYIEQLERESQYCRDELNNLLGKVKEVISENEHLHEAQKNKLISRMFHTYNAGSETDDLDDVGDSTGLDSDNKVSPTKTRRPKSRSVKLEGPNIVFESRIAELEAQLTQAKIDLKKVQDENNENKRKLANGLVDSTCLDGFKRQIDNLQRDKSTLESQISKLKLNLEQKESDLDTRYKRGSDAVEQQLREERNNLELEIDRLKAELATERGRARSASGEGARRAARERSAAEQRYLAHCDELQHDLAAQFDNVAKLQLDLERQRREENDLKRELSMKNAAIEELKMELKNKSASLQADLAQAHAEKASLEEELASARLAIERHQRQSKHEVNRLNSEIQSLRQRLDRADADLVHSRRENLRLSEQISNLEKELNLKNLTPISPEKDRKDKELSTMLESMENKHAKTVAELESMIHSQNSLMEKLTSECRLLTDKLDDTNRRHKKELATLQRQVEHLGQSLQSAYSHPPNNQAPSTHTTNTNRISNSPTGARSDHSRNESARDSAFRENNDIGDVAGDHETARNINEPIQDQINDKNISQDAQNYSTEITQDVVSNEEDSNENLNVVEKKITKQNSHDSNGRDEKSVKKKSSREMTPEKHIKNEIEKDVSKNEEFDEDQRVAETTDNKEQDYTEPVEYPNENDKPLQQTEQFETQNYNEENYPNYDQPQYTEQFENYEQYPEQYADPNSQQFVDPNTQQYADPNTQQFVDPNTQQYADPNTQQFVDPNTQQYDDPNTQQYTDPNAQTFVDPNAQYEGQYENYATDENYTEQTYDDTQYNQEYSDETVYPEAVPDQTAGTNENTSPNDKVASQS